MVVFGVLAVVGLGLFMGCGFELRPEIALVVVGLVVVFGVVFRDVVDSVHAENINCSAEEPRQLQLIGNEAANLAMKSPEVNCDGDLKTGRTTLCCRRDECMQAPARAAISNCCTY